MSVACFYHSDSAVSTIFYFGFSVLECRQGTDYAVNFIETCLEHEQLHGDHGRSMQFLMVFKMMLYHSTDIAHMFMKAKLLLYLH